MIDGEWTCECENEIWSERVRVISDNPHHRVAICLDCSTVFSTGEDGTVTFNPEKVMDEFSGER